MSTLFSSKQYLFTTSTNGYYQIHRKSYEIKKNNKMLSPSSICPNLRNWKKSRCPNLPLN
ncbi:hypothetical protein bsdtb5_42280 [Anaeromicropila herbilytica]|uniref:Uncharacterized protein n=1 Tax=Anaeromicropila herbilytica TaxID=2785025 RepID=A0A7R7IGB4_9FIRM|nr:hypothetical protein bsdtb5_42280 [Anaeromicropila herbilytica]